MKTYKMKVRFLFEGVLTIDANSYKEAKEIVDKNFGTTIGTIESNIPDEYSADWVFPVHPDKTMARM